MIISHNIDYFELLLDKSRNRNGVINADTADIEKIRIAFEKSHDIRKFEINLYWQRSIYLLSFISVLIVAIAYCFSLYVNDDTKDTTKFIILMTIAGLTLVGITLCRFWSRIIKASKYWQENWEFNIDILEPYISGNLHKMHFYRTDESYNRFSIHEVNLSICARLGIILYIVNFFSFIMIFNRFIPFWKYNDFTIESIYLSLAPIILTYLFVDIFVLQLFKKKDKQRKKNRTLNKNQLKVAIDKIRCSRG
ncbi:TPA: hypothetical protein ACJ2XA_004261, partial [Kluyvera georgiana]